jgi:hypothetical protein
MNYSFFIMVIKDMMLMDVKGQLGTAPTTYPLLSL